MIESFTVISGVIALWAIVRNRGTSRWVFWTFTILIVLFIGLRWEMGTDWRTHKNYFDAPIGYWYPGVELGYVLYSWSIRLFTDNYSVYLLLTTALQFGTIFPTVFALSNRSFLGIFYLAGTLPWYAGSLRQMFACALFTLALKASMDRKLKRFLVLMFLALMCHTTAIVFVPVYWLYGLQPLTLAIVWLGTAVVATVSAQLIPTLDMIVAWYGFGRSYANRAGGIPEMSNPLLGFTRKIGTVGGLLLFCGAARSSPGIDHDRWIKVRFVMMLASVSLIFYYIGTYAINYASSRLDIYTGIIATGLLIGMLDRLLTTRANRLLLFLFVVLLVGVFYSRLEFMDLFHPYSSVFYNYELHRTLY